MKVNLRHPGHRKQGKRPQPAASEDSGHFLNNIQMVPQKLLTSWGEKSAAEEMRFKWFRKASLGESPQGWRALLKYNPQWWNHCSL